MRRPDQNHLTLFEVSSESYQEFIDNIDHSTQYSRQQMNRYNSLVGLVPEKDRKYFNLHYKDGLTQAEIAKEMKVSRQYVSKKIKSMESRLSMFNKLPIDMLPLVEKTFKNLISKRDLLVWRSYIKHFNYNSIAKELECNPITVYRSINRIKESADRCGNPKIRKLVIGLINRSSDV